MRISDWSSDVCSSDLPDQIVPCPAPRPPRGVADDEAEIGPAVLDKLQARIAAVEQIKLDRARQPLALAGRQREHLLQPDIVTRFRHRARRAPHLMLPRRKEKRGRAQPPLAPRLDRKSGV